MQLKIPVAGAFIGDFNKNWQPVISGHVPDYFFCFFMRHAFGRNK